MNVEDAFDWIAAQTSRWFAVVAFNAPHTPLHTPTANCDGVSSLVQDINGMIECVNDQYKFIYRDNYSTAILDQELYAVSDLEEINNLFGTGVPDEAALLTEMNSMWASESYDPQIACP